MVDSKIPPGDMVPEPENSRSTAPLGEAEDMGPPVSIIPWIQPTEHPTEQPPYPIYMVDPVAVVPHPRVVVPVVVQFRYRSRWKWYPDHTSGVYSLQMVEMWISPVQVVVVDRESIRLSGKTITNNGIIRVKGATPPSGGTGGGGRVAFNYSTNLTEGTVDTGSGVYQGTIGYNTPPTVSSGNTATATFSNDNYRKRLATRYDDLVVWYPFDEGQGATATDYSINSRDGTLKNMTAANRVGGKIGGALSFDTRNQTFGDSTGQYVDMGTWSFGGAHTLAAWVKADEWREWTHHEFRCIRCYEYTDVKYKWWQLLGL